MPDNIAEIPYPYQLTKPEMVTEPHAGQRSLVESLRWLAWEAAEQDLISTCPMEEQLERIMRAAVLLKWERPEASMAECLDTAIVWERG